MKLLTKEIIAKLKKSPFYSTEKQDVAPVIVKYFAPWTNWTWFVLEATQEDGEWMFFGLVQGHETELGYFSLAELQSVTGPFGLRIERDLYLSDCVVDKTSNEVRRAS